MARTKPSFIQNPIVSDEEDTDFNPEDIPHHESPVDDKQQALQDSNKLNGWNIVTIEADISLQNFPTSLKSQIEAYLQDPDAETENIAAPRTDFKLHRTVNKKRTNFLETDSTNVLDCALYRWDVPNRDPLRIVVVNSRHGSSFNNKKPAVIFCHGKVKSKDAEREVVSRWTVWTPDQSKKGLTVDRVVVKDTVNATGHKSTKATSSKRKAPVSCSDIDASLDASRLQNTEVDGTALDSMDDSLGMINTKRTRVRASGRTIKPQSQPGGQDVVTNSTARNKALPASSPGLLQDLPAHARRSLQPMEPAVDLRLLSRTPATQTVNKTPLGSVENKQTRDNAAASQILFSFQADAGSDILYQKDFTYCNTVQKMFAYARRARISNASTMILSASIGSHNVAVVQDDEEEFNGLLQLVEKVRREQIEEHAVVEVVITAFED